MKDTIMMTQQHNQLGKGEPSWFLKTYTSSENNKFNFFWEHQKSY